MAKYVVAQANSAHRKLLWRNPAHFADRTAIWDLPDGNVGVVLQRFVRLTR